MNIKLVGVTKKIKKNNVLENINFEFESGKIHGIFGGHNSGKTLLLNLISNFCSPNSGEILFDGVSKKNNDLPICYISTNLTMVFNYKYNLKKFKEVFPNFDIEYANSLIEKFGLTSNRMDVTSSTGTMSLMRIIITLASNSRILIFDDIIAGLDIFNRKLVYNEILEKYNKDKQTIFMACSYLNEVEALLNDFIILNDSSIALSGCIDLLDRCYVISGAKDNVIKYENKKHVIKTKLDSFYEMVVIDSSESEFENVEVRKASLQDVISSYGGIYEE